MNEEIILDPARYDAPASPASPVAAVPVPGALIGPTSPPVTPSQSREVEIEAQLTAIAAKIPGELNQQKRMALHDQKLALEREQLGPANTVHLTINPAMGERQAEKEAAPSVYGPPPAAPAGQEWDHGALKGFEALAAINDVTPVEHQTMLRDYVWSGQRMGMDPDVRIAEGVPELEAAFGPVGSPRYEIEMGYATDFFYHLPADKQRELKAVGADQDARWMKWWNLGWHRQHPQP